MLPWSLAKAQGVRQDGWEMNTKINKLQRVIRQALTCYLPGQRRNSFQAFHYERQGRRQRDELGYTQFD